MPCTPAEHRMKVLMTADAVGGVWTYAIELCAALARHDIDVVLATLGPRPARRQRESALRLDNVHLVSGHYRLEWMADSLEDVRRAGGWLQKLAADERVALIHLNGYAHAALPWSQPTIVVAHSCVGTWWQAVHGEPAPHEWSDYRHNLVAGLARADCIVAPTNAFLAQLRGLYGPLPRARVIHNARSAAVFTGEPAPMRLPIVFACGRLWDEAKRLRTLDAVARELPWPVFVAGEPLSPSEGRAVAPQAAFALGELGAEDVANWMRRAAIFVHPACYEPFGLVVLEAALAGCALVLADLPTLRETWDGAAIFFDGGNERELCRALLDLIALPSRRGQLALAARSRAARFSPAAMARDYVGLYRELLRTPPLHAPLTMETTT
jgi:glycogen(starch) synthase